MGKTKVKLLLHSENGAFPFLTSHLLNKYFATDDDLIQSHLILGISIKDSCVFPFYKNSTDEEDASVCPSHEKKKKRTAKRKLQETSSLRGKTLRPNKVSRIENGGSGFGTNSIIEDIKSKSKPTEEDTFTSKSSNINSENKATTNNNNNKPMGYTFQSRSLSDYFHILPGYQTMAVPTFDLLDDMESLRDVPTKKKKHKQKQQTPITSTKKIKSPNATKNPNVISVLSNDKTVSLSTSHGMQKISPELYSTVTQSLQCDSTVCLYDQVDIMMDKPKRKVNCHERTKRWLIACLQQWYHPLLPSITCTMEKKKNSAMIKYWIPTICQPIVPHKIDPGHTNNLEKVWKDFFVERMSKGNMEESSTNRRSTTIHSPMPIGVTLIGWHRISCHDKRISMLQQIRDGFQHAMKHNNISAGTGHHELDKDLSLAVLATNDVGQILEAAQNGVSVIGSNLPTSWARKRIAFNFYSIANNENGPAKDSSQSKVYECLDLSDPIYERDTRLLLEGCTCPSCKDEKYTRAYIHHLMKSQELLADILLFSHNLQQMLLLCRELSQ